jgi:hypothetical protein
MQGDNGHALGEAKPQVLVPAAACGNGQDDGHSAPLLAGAKAHGKAIGLPPQYFAGQHFSVDSHDHSEAKLQSCVEAKRDASIPDTHFRQREPRCATQERHKPCSKAQCT